MYLTKQSIDDDLSTVAEISKKQKYGTIVVEDLRIKQMVRGNLARAIHDAAWAGLLH